MSYALNDLLKEISEASENYEHAQLQTRAAMAQETAALNRLNELQKKFDDTVKTMKDEAPRDSDWSRAKFVQTGVCEK